MAGAAALTFAVGLAPLATAGTADGQGAQKRGLFPTDESSNNMCNASAVASPGSPNGFAILNAPGKVGAVTKIVGEISLKNAPGSYLVKLAMNGTCMVLGTLTTNNQGNGNFHVDTSGTSGTYYVVLQNMANSAASFATAPVPLI